MSDVLDNSLAGTGGIKLVGLVFYPAADDVF